MCNCNCESLDLNDIKLTNKLYQLLINQCDLTGIKKLHLSKLSINCNDDDNKNYNGNDHVNGHNAIIPKVNDINAPEAGVQTNTSVNLVWH